MPKNYKTPSAQDYVHLHNHTQYSLLDGLTKIGPLLDFVKESRMQAVAKTDHRTLAGTIEFYKSAQAKGIKPIIGFETYVAARKYTDKDPRYDKLRYHLVLLAMNNQGYQNLLRLSTLANLQGFYYYPRVDHELLSKHSDGLIAMSACASGEVAYNLKNDQPQKAEEALLWYKSVFKDRFYLEVQDFGHPKNPQYCEEQGAINNKIIKLGQQHEVPIIVTCDAHYLKKEDQEAHEILLCVGTGSFISDSNRMSMKDYPLFLEHPNEIIKRWGKEHPDFIYNTKKIADSCNVDIELGKFKIPKFDVPAKETEQTYLEKLVYRGLAFRYGVATETQSQKLSVSQAKKLLPKHIKQRAEFELSTVKKMNFSGYFLIIWDFIKWGKDNGIVFGPGRGSAAGSIMAYALKITDLDPIKYDLLFERFLNPDRISMPDIDIDIQDSRRDEVIRYCIQKYGEERVANIGTFGTMAARAAVRDVARVLEVPYAEADRLAKMVPPPLQGRHIPIEISIKDNAELRQEYNNNPVSRRVLDMASRLEGTVRSLGVHAAGVVIAPDDIVKFVPLQMAQKGVVTTQYSMGPVEDLGLLKMDFLGLANLTIIKNALRIIKKVHGQNIDIGSLPLSDKKTYELLSRGDTIGVFQLESAGMKRYLKQLKPSEFEDIIAMVALYRPGPMQFIEDFIDRKHGRKKIEYLHPKMENALKSTYGVLVYQEQFMQISKDLAGFTGGQADTLRKAVGKKIMDLMKKVKPEFIEGAVKHSQADPKLMQKFWSQLEEFANYCFNKSHAACYAMIAYWTAYLKANYPAAFMSAVMTSDYDNIDRLAIEINECKKMGIKVLPPDVNQSFHEFSIVPGKKITQIRFGLDAVKNVGSGAVEEIIEARESKGLYTSIEDFLSKVDNTQINRKVWESLIRAGAFDRFADRGCLLDSIDKIIATGSKVGRDKNSGQIDLFSNTDNKGVKLSLDIPKKNTAYSDHDYLQWEKELLGLYLSKHPLEDYEVILSEQTVPLAKVTNKHDNQLAVVGGMVSAIRQITTKNGQPMAFVRLEDINGDDRELVVFPSVYKEVFTTLNSEKVLKVKGRINATDQNGNLLADAKIIVNSVTTIDIKEAKEYKPTGRKKSLGSKKANSEEIPAEESIQWNEPLAKPKRLYLRMPDSDDLKTLHSLKQILDDNPGKNETVLVIGQDKQIIRLPQKVDCSDKVVESLCSVLGKDSVKLQ
ncbi:DNA polymerase III subunit alpha [Candidatus Saccharibacteria bacterium]|nr:DNA polymerase III subunit alpha [Candidatus Saccharibacteria bacterium]HOR23116.1 DNA polymerase III subunit alpha [Candidatus Saccharibacteria bacterium]HPW47749.1 DNA polymerase III subunit alpha [Candidatus Saccharibacteria bacterium]